ncbi:NAD(P)-dependent dehydrogenase (short-subunit alcohol dehydrogenase family) [Nocardioides daedukensis]|uniref:NAD(P)-dependent dehydrogenase (Short-subunit alcohol dehydrogenase family) n=1 Tax=Nocardioides daedukensis TaxID=634462 RepID=A0A7Y9S009_9ACTN|nr:NAD(P)-dependent dehydrogenase (short-subunit alcohol dehydrogenase family) [Nocardioides daedukensis]
MTGGASGLGAATTQRLAAAGATVVVADLVSAWERRTTDFGDEVRFVATDVTAEDEVVAAVRAAVELGELRAAVACAGIGHQGRLLGSRGPVDAATVRRVMDVNFGGTVSLLGHAADAMQHNELRDGERGVVVMVASAAGLDSSSVAYGGSKAAVVGVTAAAARELSSRAIRVVTVAPGIFETPMVAGMSESAVASVGRPAHPDRLGRPDEFASFVAHIVENAMINGEVVRLDAALRAPAVIQ